jgi:cytochrome c553
VSHRIVAAAVRLVLLAFVASAVAFALAVRSPGGAEGAWPATHRNFGARTCATCHGR